MRYAVVVMTIIVSLSGCATLRNTPAQDLALEAWHRCQNSAVTLKEVTQDGVVWYVYYNMPGSELRAFEECMRLVASEQRTRENTIRPSAVAARTTIDDSASVPVWKPGDEWEYRWETPRGKGTYVWSVDRIETLSGTDYYVVKSGQSREIYWRKSDLSYYMDKVGGQIESRWLLKQGTRIPWPLVPGNTWEWQYIQEVPGDRQTEELFQICRVDREEALTVPAGTFKTFAIVCTNERRQPRYEVWYSPAVRHWVKERTHFSNGVRDRELINYRRR